VISLASSSPTIEQRPWRERLRRWARYRFVVPLRRSRHSPEYVARGVSSGLFWAMTPTVGVQMAMVMAQWLFCRALRRWEFNVVHAMAWTWITNVLTLLPFYYMFYVTGQVFLGRWGDLSGYRSFTRLWETSFISGTGAGGAAIGAVEGWVEGFWTYFDVIIAGWGLAMLVGCIPYAIIAAWLGYRWSLGLVLHHRRARFERRVAAHHETPPTPTSGNSA